MRAMTKVLVALVAIAVAAAVYLATVGVAVYQDDFTGPDGNGSDAPDVPTPDTIAYAFFEVHTSVWLYDSVTVNGYVTNIYTTVKPYVSPSEGRVVSYEPWNPFAAKPPTTKVGEFWIVVKVTGSGGYLAAWNGLPIPILSTDLEPSPAIWDTGRAFFTANGAYVCEVTLYAKLDSQGVVKKIGSLSATFNVNVNLGG